MVCYVGENRRIALKISKRGGLDIFKSYIQSQSLERIIFTCYYYLELKILNLDINEEEVIV